MDLEILDIASDTENNRNLRNHTHFSKLKNSMCGDEIQIKLIIKDDKIIDFGYQGQSCIYCQASVSLLSRWVMQTPIEKISDFISKAEFFFDENFDQLNSEFLSAIAYRHEH